jgi:hypothetical protein
MYHHWILKVHISSFNLSLKALWMGPIRALSCLHYNGIYIYIYYSTLGKKKGGKQLRWTLNGHSYIVKSIMYMIRVEILMMIELL